MVEDIQAAIPLGFLLSFMVGPVFFVLLETSAIKGFRAGLFFNVGVIVADVLFLFIAYFSSFQLLENLSNLPGLYVFGGTILFIYGVIIFIKKETKKDKVRPSKGTYLGLVVKGFLLNFINIGVLIFWLGVLIVVGPNLDNSPNRIVVFFGTMLTTYFITDLFKILLAKQLKRKLTIKRIAYIKKVLGLVLVVCGIVLIIKGFLPKDKFNIKDGIERINEQKDPALKLGL